MAKDIASIFAKIKRLDPKVNELKVFKGGEELMSEAERLNEKIMGLKTLPLGEAEFLRPFIEKILGHGFPLVPFPAI